MRKLSFNEKRVVCGIATSMVMLCLANHYLEWGIFGQFSKEVLIVSWILLFLGVVYVGPSLEEVQDYRDKKNREKHLPIGIRSWMYCVPVSFVMLFFVLDGPMRKLVNGKPIDPGDWLELLVIETAVLVGAIIGWFRYRHWYRCRVKRTQSEKADRT